MVPKQQSYMNRGLKGFILGFETCFAPLRALGAKNTHLRSKNWHHFEKGSAAFDLCYTVPALGVHLLVQTDHVQSKHWYDLQRMQRRQPWQRTVQVAVSLRGDPPCVLSICLRTQRPGKGWALKRKQRTGAGNLCTAWRIASFVLTNVFKTKNRNIQSARRIPGRRRPGHRQLGRCRGRLGSNSGQGSPP